MMCYLFLVVAAVVLFATYNGVAIGKFGIPSSLSETFYLYQGLQKGLGYVFTGMMMCMVFLLMPAWLSISEAIGGWEQYLTFLAFFAAGSIAFVGAAPAFRGCELESKVHCVSAKLAAAFSLSWCAVVCWRIAYIIPIALLVVWAVALITKTAKRCSTYWLEMCAFVATFATVITECILLM